MPTLRLRVLLFAGLREAAGAEILEISAPAPCSAAGLLRHLARTEPHLAPHLTACRVAVDRAFVPGDHPLAPDSEIALIPPVSGGHDGPAPWRVPAEAIAVVDRPLELAAVLRPVTHGGAGGIATFTGNVRRHSRGQTVRRLVYQAYVPMAERVLRDIAQALADATPGLRVAIHHRVGDLAVGDTAVVIAASAPHRAPAFAACRDAIERLKADVPIWKHEHTASGAVWVGQGP